jgi:hypothetical protein
MLFAAIKACTKACGIQLIHVACCHQGQRQDTDTSPAEFLFAAIKACTKACGIQLIHVACCHQGQHQDTDTSPAEFLFAAINACPIACGMQLIHVACCHQGQHQDSETKRCMPPSRCAPKRCCCRALSSQVGGRVRFGTGQSLRIMHSPVEAAMS